eukprot:Rhum_TRINITY_DN14793_c4_g1::Rhum_TRINITY_DN14793_c4_g1_i1::g.117432::m.117432
MPGLRIVCCATLVAGLLCAVFLVAADPARARSVRVQYTAFTEPATSEPETAAPPTTPSEAPGSSVPPPDPQTPPAKPEVDDKPDGAKAPGPKSSYPFPPADPNVNLTQVTRLTDKAVVFPTADPDALAGRLPRGIIASTVCTQQPSCEHFKDVLYIIHLNPQRFDWMEPSLEYVLRFVPFVMIVTLALSRDPAHNTLGNFDEQRADLSHIFLGPNKRYVHLIDSGEQGVFGDHNDIVMAMRLYPNFRGYLYCGQEDVLPGFWNMVHLNKELPWHQPVTPKFSFQSRYKLCKSYKHRSAGRQSGSCVMPMKAMDARDWRKILPALAKIKEDSQSDYDRIIPGAVLGFNIYYVPRNMFARFERYSSYMFQAMGYLEFSSGALIQAARGPDQGHETLHGINVWVDAPPHKLGHGRFHPVNEFKWQYHFTHPVRVPGDLLTRLTDIVKERQIVDVVPKMTEKDMWEACYTCNEYPQEGPFSINKKGRYHSCVRGCSDASKAENVTSRGGRVQIAMKDSVPASESEAEGFWNRHKGLLFYQGIRDANLSASRG